MRKRLAPAVLGVSIVTTVLLIASCSILATRPVQEFSDTASALRAAREVQADTLAPELYREAGEWWIKARREYKFKNFSFAKEYALKAQELAEQAEFESLRNGGNRAEQIPDPMAQATAPDTTATPAPTPDTIGQPEGIPVEDYDKIKAQRDEEKAKDVNQAPSINSNPTQVNQTNPYGGNGAAQRGGGTSGTGTGTGTTTGSGTGTATGTGTSP